MGIPHGGDMPTSYKPNAEDDRQVTGPQSAVYLSVATAIEEIESVAADRPTFLALPLDTRRAIRLAERALRRAAFGIVVHAR